MLTFYVIIGIIGTISVCQSFQLSLPLNPIGRSHVKTYLHSKAPNESKKKMKKGPRVTPRRERPRIPVLQYHDDWVCVSKPAGLTVHRGGNTSRRQLVLSTLLKRQLARKVFPVHRLDHRTSGAILFSFDSATCGLLQKALTGDGTEVNDASDGDGISREKNYIALVRGDWKRKFAEDEVVTVDRPLNVTGMMKDASTEFRLLASSPGDEDEGPYSPSACSLVLCTPKTGRTHQIRRHAYSLGFSIIGDTQHGDSKINRWWRENRDLDRLFLHCLSLSLPPLSTFDETKSKEPVNCVAPLPAELVLVLEREDMKDLWKIAKKKDPRLLLEVFDDRGGTYGRNFRTTY
jgi:tRNA pseudouridine65 synthase